VSPDDAQGVIASLHDHGVNDAVAIGQINSTTPGKIVVTRKP
jgi:hypothetical protein